MWNKTSMSYSAQGPLAMGVSSGVPIFFYVGTDRTLYHPSWVSADEDITVKGSHTWRQFKEGGLGNDSSSNMLSDNIPINVTAFPNPSGGAFTIAINNVGINTELTLSITSIDGGLVYNINGQVQNGSGQCVFTWEAISAESGIYFCKVESSDGRNITVKIIVIFISHLSIVVLPVKMFLNGIYVKK
jgi:hypothetical protein